MIFPRRLHHWHESVKLFQSPCGVKGGQSDAQIMPTRTPRPVPSAHQARRLARSALVDIAIASPSVVEINRCVLDITAAVLLVIAPPYARPPAP